VSRDARERDDAEKRERDDAEKREYCTKVTYGTTTRTYAYTRAHGDGAYRIVRITPPRS